MFSPFDVIGVPKYRNLNGEVCCADHEAMGSCRRLAVCLQFHSDVDCAQFMATGCCILGHQCKLRHSQRRREYAQQFELKNPDVDSGTLTAWHNMPSRSTLPLALLAQCAISQQLLNTLQRYALAKAFGKLFAAIDAVIRGRQATHTAAQTLLLLEQLFRARHMDVWLTTVPFDEIKMLREIQQTDQNARRVVCRAIESASNKSWQLIVLLDSPEAALCELLQTHNSYDASLATLYQCGMLVVDPAE